MFTGCYDQNDIENIKSIALICVDEENLYFCSAAPVKDENKYNYEIYSVKTDNLYYGINKLTQITGKEISLSHIEAMIFSDKCNYNNIKKCINSLLKDTNSHPKVMTAFFKGEVKSILDMISNTEYSNLSEHIDYILTNKYITTTKCTARQLSCALNFDVPGYCVPLISISNDNVVIRESVFVNNFGMQYIDEPVTSLINLINNKNGRDYVLYDGKAIPVILLNSKKYLDETGAEVILNFGDLKNKKIIEYFNNEIKNFYKNGYDLLGFGELLNKKFVDEKSKNTFLSEFNDFQGWIRQLNVNIEVTE